MSNEELKRIVEEVVGNNDPYWNEPVLDIVNKIINLPENTEISILDLITGEYSDTALSDISNDVMEVLDKSVILINGKRIKIILDNNTQDNSFVIKYMILPDEVDNNFELIKD